MKIKEMSKAQKARLYIVLIIIVCDVLFLPLAVKLIEFATQDLSTALENTLSYGIINAILFVVTNEKGRGLFLILQLPVFALCVGASWNVYQFKTKNKVGDGVGGPEAAGQGQHGTSRWQSTVERDKTAKVWLTSEPLKKGGIIFGMEKQPREVEKIWVNDDDAHTLIIGATRSGKGRRIILPSIWEIAKSGESMILGDPKGELYIATKEFLEKQGYNIIVMNLREPLKGNQWNMLEMVNRSVDQGDISKATELAWDIANAIVNQKPSTGEPLWQNGEESTIAALTLLSALESDFKFQRHMTTAYYLLGEYGQPLDDETIPLLEYIKTLDVKHPAKSAFATASIAPYKTRASFFTTALADLRLFSDPNISDMTSKQDHDLEKIGIDKTAVFLIIPDEKSTRNVLATLYIDQVYQTMVDLANKRGGRIPRRVNFILDEFGNLPPIPSFATKLTVAGGRGCKFTIAVQDLAQLKKNYDKDAQTITGNCHNWIFLKTADVETAKVISEKTGKYTVETDSSSSSLQNKGHSISHSNSLTGRALLLPDEILRWDTKESLILSMGLFPARYPLPDLAQYKANTDFGFVKPTKNMDADKESNRIIIEERWANIIPRPIEEVSIWLPPIEIEKSNSKESQHFEMSFEEVEEEEDILW